MAIIIDTYNCVHAGAAMGGALADLSVRTLCRWIVAAPRREKTALVLDGRPKPQEPSENEFPDLHFVYSGAGITADLVIHQMADRSDRREALTVITNDRALAASVRHVGARVVPCETYLKKLIGSSRRAKSSGGGVSQQKSTGTSSPGETESWLQEFGITNVPPPNPPAKIKNPDDEDELDIEKLLGPRE